MQTNRFSDAQIAQLIEPTNTFNSADPITRVIGNLLDSNEYDAIIEDGEKVSVVSIRDFLNVGNIITEKLTRIMKQVPRLSPSDSISIAARVMFEHKLRSLPVYDGKKLLGKIPSSSLAKALLESNHHEESIARIATPDPICVQATASVAKAKRLMVNRKIDQLPIMKEKRLVGVITSKTIASRILPKTDRTVMASSRIGRMEIDVISLASAQTVTNEVTDTLVDTLDNMLRTGSNYSVIVSGDEIQGIVTYRDFLKLLPKSDGSKTPFTIVGLPEDPLQSEMAKKKFKTSVALLSKIIPNLIEARAVIKSGETKAPKKRYHVQVFISTTDSRRSYQVSSFDLARAFEEIEVWTKKLASQRRRRGKSEESKTRRKTALI
ncbi:MAG: CBS domain-containing protein [Nitrososphaerota archaeon]|nr:CBS domain-containing protein [Nitrososphaerota archaeon]